MYEVLVSGGTQTDLTNWVSTYSLFNNSVRAKDDQTLSELEERECTYLVETATMEITWRLCTCLGGNCEPSIVPGLAELDAALNP